MRRPGVPKPGDAEIDGQSQNDIALEAVIVTAVVRVSVVSARVSCPSFSANEGGHGSF